MDNMSIISKVANRKRINTNVEELIDKVSRETANIIKIKVDQDTAYWDLKEKLKQVEGNHERLQRNMAEVQLQHETLLGSHQEELRRRPETLHRVIGTRSICDKVEESAARLKATLARTSVDCAALSTAYDAAARRLREKQAEQAQEHLARRNDADRALHLRQQLDAAARALQEKHELVVELRAAARRSEQEFEARLLHATDAMARQEKEVSVAREVAVEADQRAQHAAAAVHELRLQLQEARRGGEEAARRADELDQHQRALALSIQDNEQELAAARAAASDLTDRLTTVEVQKAQLESEFKSLTVDANRTTMTIEELVTDNGSLEGTLHKIQDEFETYRRNGEAQIAELRECALHTGRSLDAATEKITQLMDDIRADTEACAKLQADLDAALHNQHQLADRADRADTLARELTARKPPLAAPVPVVLEAELGPSTATPPAPAMLYDFLSDSSSDGKTINASEVRRHFEALSRAARSGHRPITPPPRFDHAAISLSQVKNDLKKKERAFFKNKRFDSKAKKPK